MTTRPTPARTLSIRTEGLEAIATRTFDAPRAQVFAAWSECERLTHWWGPKDWTLPVCELDFRSGGSWFYCMRGPDGTDACGRATYSEIVEPSRIVYTDAFADRDGKLLPGMPEMVVTILFDEVDGKTVLTSRVKFASAADLETVLATGMESGLTETWDRLEAYLAAS